MANVERAAHGRWGCVDRVDLAADLVRSKLYVPSSCHFCAHRASMPSMVGFSGTRESGADDGGWLMAAHRREAGA